MIRLIYRQLVYDIQQQTWRLAHPRTEGNAELRDMSQLDDSQTDDDYIRRFVESGVAMLHVKFRSKLVNPDTGDGWWTGWGEYDANDGSDDGSDEGGDEQIHDDAINRSVVNYDFTLGCNADEKALAMLFHRFVVRYVLWQWCRTFGFADASADFQAEQAGALEEIEDALFDIGLPKKYHEAYYGCYCDGTTEADEAEIIIDNG